MLSLLAAIAPSATPDPAKVERLVQMFSIVAGVLGAFLLLVIAMTTLRRKRAQSARARTDGRSDAGPLDAWSEAGRRVEPYGGGRRAEEGRGR